MIDIKDIGQYKSDKVIDFNAAVGMSSRIKPSGKTVGLCHGGFDLTHPGHAKHFETAKKLCDVLFVSITSDRFVESRKGIGRPIYPDNLRAYMVASFASVDYVFISDFKSAVEVIGAVKPSYYIKGPDFISKETAGIEAERLAVKNAGGEIRYTTDKPLSTTAIIDYIKSSVERKRLLVCVDRDGTLIGKVDFLGRNDNWKDEIALNDGVVSFLSYLQRAFSTTFIVVSNQAGVARGFFGVARVEEINKHIDSELKRRGISINSWQYCPYVDEDYAKNAQVKFLPEFASKKTARKPSTEMAMKGLEDCHHALSDFDSILVIGDRHEDEGLALNLNARYIDVKGKTTGQMIKELQS